MAKIDVQKMAQINKEQLMGADAPFGVFMNDFDKEFHELKKQSWLMIGGYLLICASFFIFSVAFLMKWWCPC